MATADSVRSWAEDLREAFPFHRDPANADVTWLDHGAMPPRTDRILGPLERASVDPRTGGVLLEGWIASVAAHLGVPASSVVPTMGTHMTVERAVSLLDMAGPGRYLVTPDAHMALMNPLEILYAKDRAEVLPLALDDHGRIDLGFLTDRLDAGVRAVMIPHVSSVTGARLEIDAAAALVRHHREQTGATTILVVDGAQAVPRIPVDASGADLYVFSSQKAGGIPGSVAVVGGAAWTALAPAGSTPEEARSHVMRYLGGGTVHVGAIGALAEALAFLDGLPALDEHTEPGMASVAAAIGLLRDRLIGSLRDVPEIEILFAPEEPAENAGLVSFQVAGRTAEEVGRALTDRHVHVRVATEDRHGQFYCAPLVERLVPGIRKRGGALRASLWVTNTPEDVDRLVEVVRGE